MINRFKEFIVNKLYHLLENYRATIDQETKKNINFKKKGQQYHIGKDSSFYNPQFIEIGNSFYCKNNNTIEAVDRYYDAVFQPAIVIGNNVTLINDNHIGATNYIEIGDDTLVASRVFITDHFHGQITRDENDIPPEKRKLFSKGPVIIGKKVWIGEGVCIMPNVTIGDHCIVGANSVVTKSFPSFSVIGGNPAKLLKTLK